MATTWDDLQDAINLKLLQEIESDEADSRDILRLTEARAWILHPGQAHGAAASSTGGAFA